MKVRQWDLPSRQAAAALPGAGAGDAEVSKPVEGRPGVTGSAGAECRRAEPDACQHIPVLTLPPADADSTAVTVRPYQHGREGSPAPSHLFAWVKPAAFA